LTYGSICANAVDSGLVFCPVVSGLERAATAGRGEYAEKFEASARTMIFLTTPILLLTDGGKPGGRHTDCASRGRGLRGELTSSARRLLQAISDLLQDRSALADVPHSRLAVRHYHVIYDGLSQVWSRWVKLTDGQWIQSAEVVQTDSSGDGPVPRVPDCLMAGRPSRRHEMVIRRR